MKAQLRTKGGDHLANANVEPKWEKKPITTWHATCDNGLKLQIKTGEPERYNYVVAPSDESPEEFVGRGIREAKEPDAWVDTTPEENDDEADPHPDNFRCYDPSAPVGSA